MPGEGKPLGSAYILHEPLGGGAWGEVWRGSERATGGPVAIKILRPELARDPQLVSRFLMERSMLLDVRHPSLVSVRDLVAEGGTLAIVMDLVEGGDLHYLIQRRGILSPREASQLMAGVASALATVHAAGIIHSDVKPANILVDERFSPPMTRLTDFGLAALAGTTGRGPTGTPEYMAPELASGGAAIAATDLYACGVVLYEAVTGVLPFDTGGDITEMLRSHVEEPVPRPPHLQNDMWEIIRSLLAKWPGSRPTAAQLAERLTSVAAGAAPVIPRPAPSPAPAPAWEAEQPRTPAWGARPIPVPLEELLARAHEAAELPATPPVPPAPAPAQPVAFVAPEPVAVPQAPIAPVSRPTPPVAAPEPVVAPTPEPLVPAPPAAVARPTPVAAGEASAMAAEAAAARVVEAASEPVALPPVAPAEAAEEAAAQVVEAALAPTPTPDSQGEPVELPGAPDEPGTSSVDRPAPAAVEGSSPSLGAPIVYPIVYPDVYPDVDPDAKAGRITRAGDRRERPAALTPVPGKRAAAPLTPLPGQIPVVPPLPPAAEAPRAPMNPLPSHRAPMARPPKAAIPRQSPPTPLPRPGPKAEKPASAKKAAEPEAPGTTYADLFPGLRDKPEAARPQPQRPEPKEDEIPDIESVLAAAPPPVSPVKRPPKAPEPAAFTAPAEPKTKPDTKRETKALTKPGTKPRTTAQLKPQLKPSALKSKGQPGTRPERTGGDASPLKARLPVLILVAAVVIAVAIAVIVANHHSTTVATNAGGANYAFPKTSYPGSVVVQRSWALSDSGVLSGTLVITDSGSATGVTYDEVIPKSVASSASAITFSPAPAKVVQQDPVVEYSFPNLAPGASTTVGYTAHVSTGGSASNKLATLAADQGAAEAAFNRTPGSVAPTLTTLYVSATPTAIKVGGTTHLTVTGTMSDGSVASATILQGVIWTQAPAGIVIVSGSTATGQAPGITKLTASDQGVSASVGLVVTPVATPATPAAPATSRAPFAVPTHAAIPSPSPSGPAQAACVTAQAPPQPTTVSGTVTSEPIYRLCDPRTGYRLYTTSPVEWSTLAGMGDVTEPYDGYVAMQQSSGLVPLYRLTDSEGRQFLASTTQALNALEAEGAGAAQVLGYVPGGGGSGTVPLYGASTPQYGAIYTTDSGEHSRLVSQGWRDLGAVANVFSNPQ